MDSVKSIRKPVAAVAVFVLLLGLGCEKEMSITEFSDDWKNYKSELRIEAVLDASDINNSIVRIDRTILVSDTSIFNGRDDDGDWRGFSDDNGNGKWDEGEALNDDLGEDGIATIPGEFEVEPDEGQGDGKPTPGEPHIDEFDEILPQIHDSSATVSLYDRTASNKIADFIWIAEADSFETNENMENDSLSMVLYGAFKPAAVYDSVIYSHEFEFVIDTEFQGLITGSTTPIPPARFVKTNMTVIGDTIIAGNGSFSLLEWDAEPEATVFWVIVEQIFSPDSIVVLTSKPWPAFSQNPDGRQVSFDFLSQYFEGLYRWSVIVPDQQYGAYIYARLPLRDDQLSNLRDENGAVVLGIAGSVSTVEQYVRIESN